MKLAGRPVYHNDRKAPRMRKGKFSIQIINKDLLKEFKKTHPEYSEMKWDEFKLLWDDLALTIRKEVVDNPLGVKLPKFTGELKVQYIPSRNHEAIDEKRSGELGVKVKHLGVQTRGKSGIVKWERRWAVKFNKMLQFFAFNATRKLSNMAAVKFDSDPEKIRMSRNTLGGKNIWRILRNKK